MFFLYFRKLNFLIFRKTELSIPKTKKISEGNLPTEKIYIYIKKKQSEKFLIFRKMELSSPKIKILFIVQGMELFSSRFKKISYISKKWNYLALYFSYISRGNFQSLKIRKTLIFLFTFVVC